MRKYTAILCAAVLLLGLSACGKQDAPADDTVATTTTTTTAEEPAKAPLNLTYVSAFSDGIALVRYLDAAGAEKAAAINTAGAILFHLPDGVSPDGEGYKNGIRVVGDVIYDKTGAVIASPAISGYDSLLTGNCGGFVLAKKLVTFNDGEISDSVDPTATATTAATTTTTTTTTATTTTTTTAPTAPTTPTTPIIPTGMTLYVGVLNNKGEWVHPLNDLHPIAVAITGAAQPAENFTYITDDVLQVYVDTASVPQYYHFSTNTLTPGYVHYQSINYQDEDTGIYQVDANGNKKVVIKNVVSDYSFEDVFIGRTTQVNNEGEATTLIKLYDYTGKVLADLTAYPTDGKYFFIADRLLIQTDDGAGNRHLVLLDKSGKEIIQPVALNLGDVVYPPDEAGFVIESHTAEGVVSYRHYDYVGNATDYTNVTAFSGFSESLAAVTLTDGKLCYINYKAEIVIQ